MPGGYVECDKCSKECSLHIGVWVGNKAFHPWCVEEPSKEDKSIPPACTNPDGADPCRAYQVAEQLYEYAYEASAKLAVENARLKEALEKIKAHSILYTSDPPSKEWNVYDQWYNNGFDIARNIATHALKEEPR